MKTTPTIEALLVQHETATRAIQAAILAIEAAAPNVRDVDRFVRAAWKVIKALKIAITREYEPAMNAVQADLDWADTRQQLRCRIIGELPNAPTVNRNGTANEELLVQYETATRAVQAAIATVEATHERHLRALVTVRDDLMRSWESVRDQVDAREAVGYRKASVILDDIDRGWADARTQVIEAYREMYGVEPTSEFVDNAVDLRVGGQQP